MTDLGPKTVRTLDEMKELFMQVLQDAQKKRNEDASGGGASSHNLGNDMKTPKQKKKPTSKAVEALKKKEAQDKAKLAKTRKELRDKKLSESLERAEKRKKKEEERIRSLREKLNVSTGQSSSASTGQ